MCVAHEFHRAAETVRLQFLIVDLLIATVKKIFLKAPSRILKVKELYKEFIYKINKYTYLWHPLNLSLLRVIYGQKQYISDNFEQIKNVQENDS